MKKCVFTIVRDESERLPIWLRYYRRWFSDEDIIVLDNDSSDGSTEEIGCRTVKVHSPYAFDHGWLLATVQWWFEDLLRSYEVVLFVECDEIVWHPAGLDQYMDSLEKQDAACTGYEMIHMKDREPALDLGRPVCEQRGYWFHSPAYGKTLMARHPLRWNKGFHTCLNKCESRDPKLLLLHLHRMDYDLALRLHQQRAKMCWSPKDMALGHGRQSLYVGDAFEKWFYRDRNEGELHTEAYPIVEIPREIRENLGF